MANESPSGLVWKSGGAFEGPDWQKVLGAELQRLKGEVCVWQRCAQWSDFNVSSPRKKEKRKHQNKTKEEETLRPIYTSNSLLRHKVS